MIRFMVKGRIFIVYIGLIVLMFIVSISCKRGIIDNSNQLDSLRDFVENYDRIKAKEKEKKQADSVGQLLKKLPNTVETRELLALYIKKVYADISYVDFLCQQAKKDKDLKFEAKSYYLKGRNYESRFVADSAFYYYTKAEVLYESIEDTVDIKNVYLFKGIVLLNKGIFTEAETNTLKLIQLNKTQDDIKTEYAATLLLGSIFAGLGQIDDAITTLKEALEILKKPEMDKLYSENVKRLNIVTVYKNMAEAYLKSKNYDMVDIVVDEMITTYLSEEGAYDDMLIAQLLAIKAQGALARQKFKGVEKDLKQAISLNVKRSNHKDENFSKVVLGELFFLTGRNSEAIKLLDEVEAYAKEKKDVVLERDVLSKFLKYYPKDYKEIFDRYEAINIALLDENSIVKNTFARISYEADSLVRVNKKLKTQKNVITQVGSVMLALAGVVFFIVFYKQKNREVAMVKLFQRDTEKYYDTMLTLQDKLVEARRLERKDVAKELHDGVLNKLFVTRFSLMQINQDTLESQRELLINEVKEVEKYIRDVSHAFANEENVKVSYYCQLISDLVEVQNRNLKTDFSLVVCPELDLQVLSHRVKIHMYRIIQEALQNVHKYAEATTCIVIFRKKSDREIEVLIKDNGIGFNARTVKRGLGLGNIQDRCDLINANFEIISSKGKGATLIINIITD